MLAKLERLGVAFLLPFGFLCLCYGAFKVACAIALGDPGEFITALEALFLAAASLCVPLAEYAGWRAGRLFYPLSWLKAPARRLAAAEALLARREFQAAKVALEAILSEESDNLTATMDLAKTLLECDGVNGRAGACSVLVGFLDGRVETVSGASSAVLLLADLLEEDGRRELAIDMLSRELSKGYCRAEAELLRRRLDALLGL